MPALGRELAEQLVPHLRRELRNATRALQHLGTTFREPACDERGFARLERVHARARQTGWCLGLLAAEQGADLMGERREPLGLDWLVTAVLAAAGAPRPTNSLARLVGPAGPSADTLRIAWCVLRARSVLVHPLRARLSPEAPRQWLELELASSPRALELELQSRPELGDEHARLHRGWLGCRIATG